MSERKRCCENFLRTLADFGANFLKNIITIDESPISLYIPKLAKQSREGRYPILRTTEKTTGRYSSPKSENVDTFWRLEGSLFLYLTKAIKAQYYRNLLSVVRNVCKEPGGHDMYLLQDNEPIHKAAATQAN